MNQEEKISTEYDEIDLMDYVKVLLKRKWLILAVFLAAVIVAGVFSALSPKVYKIDTFLEVGKIGEQVVEELLQVVEKINSGIYEAFPGIKVSNPTNTNLIKIEITSKDPQEAKNILEEMSKLILKEHQEKIKVKKELLDKDIERIKNKITSSEKEKKDLECKERTLEQMVPYQQLNQPLSGSLFILLDIREKIANKKQEIENLYLQINSLERQLEDIQPTTVVKEPTVSGGPIKPRFLLNIVIAAVLGLFIGTIFAFFKEWWEKNKIPTEVH